MESTVYWHSRCKDYVELFFNSLSDSQHPSIGHQTVPSAARCINGVDQTGLWQHDTRRSTRSATSQTPVRAKCSSMTGGFGTEIRPHYATTARSALAAVPGAHHVSPGCSCLSVSAWLGTDLSGQRASPGG